jgi:hypothetical protein
VHAIGGALQLGRGTISIVRVIWRVLPIERIRRLSSSVFAIVPYASGLPAVDASVFDFSTACAAFSAAAFALSCPP